MKTKLFFTVVAFSAMTVFAAGQTAQTAPQVQPGQGQEQCIGNGQGRHCGMARGPVKGHPRGHGMMAGRGAGRGNGMMAGKGAGRGNVMMAGRGAGRGQGVTPGRGLHNGQGPSFVDANKDGVCDNLVTAPEKK